MLPGLAEQIAGIRRTRARDMIEKRRAERGYKMPRRADAMPQLSPSRSHMTAENRANVRALAAQHGTVSVPIVKKALGINDSSSQRLLRKMAADGELERLPYSSGTGVPNIYALPGQAAAGALVHYVDPQVRARVEKIADATAKAGRGKCIAYRNVTKSVEDTVSNDPGRIAEIKYINDHNAIIRAGAGGEKCDRIGGANDTDKTPANKTDY